MHTEGFYSTKFPAQGITYFGSSNRRILVPVLLYGYETLPVALKEGFNDFVNRGPGRILGHISDRKLEEPAQ
jgi:hypothetical protein